ncbi:MAG: YdcF family protein [Planctomycetota bacterium]
MTDELTPDNLTDICCQLDEPEQVDLAIVLGCTEPGNDPDFALRNRVRHCFELWRGGYFRRILLTGGAPIDADPSGRSEARRMCDLLSVPQSADLEILLECEARNTRENAERSSAMLQHPELQLKHSLSTIMVITCDYHTRRARHEFARAFPNCRILSCGFINEAPYRLEKCRRELIRLQRLGLVDARHCPSMHRND